jgi:hypothetical protein
MGIYFGTFKIKKILLIGKIVYLALFSLTEYRNYVNKMNMLNLFNISTLDSIIVYFGR